ncbi:MAG: ABC transporter permease [Micromonosporaceae bacterium]|nr:ABC transporter permease [Micromonosporaceae bacterium]
MSRRVGPRAWLRELLLGTRMALAGGPSGWLRAGLTALGVGLGVALLLFAVSVPHAIASRQERTAARDDVSFDAPPPRSDATILVGTADTWFRGDPVRGRLLQPDGAHPSVPPGLSEIPRPGEMVVSPALARLLASPDGELLRERLDFPIVATIGDEGLAGPTELAFYLGADDLNEASDTVTRRDHFGEPRVGRTLDPVLSLFVVIIVVVLLLPVTLFVAAAIRFGGEARDRRLAGVRLLGADAHMARRIAAGEALGSSLLGLGVGGAIFLGVRSFVDRIELFRLSVFPSDVQPHPVLTLLLVVAVPVASVAVTILSLRRVVIEPFAVTRRAGDGRRRLWWRLILPVVGIGLLVPMLGSLTQSGGEFSVTQVSLGVGLVLVGVAAQLPWAVQAAVRRVRGGPVAWQLAIRRLQLDSSAPARAVMGIAVAVAGAIGLQTLFASIEANYLVLTRADPTRAEVHISLPLEDGWADVQRLDAGAAATPGVLSVHSRVTQSAVIDPGPGPLSEDHPSTLVTVGTCDTLREFAELDSCAEGSVFLVAAAEPNDFPATPAPGNTLGFLDLRTGSAEVAVEWTVPATARAVTGRLAPNGEEVTGVLATPSAMPDEVLATWPSWAVSYVDIEDGDLDAAERLRTVVWDIAPGGYLGLAAAALPTDEFAMVRRGLLIGATVTLVMIGASLLVGVLEQLRERRRVLASLVAFGTRRRTLAWSIVWQTAVPVALGLVLATIAGVTLGAVLLRIVSQPVSVDWSAIALVAGIAALVVLGVTALSLPPLWRLMRADGLRTE